MTVAPKKSTVVLLPGDGVGPEVTAEAKRVLELVAKIRAHKVDITFKEELIGGASIDASGKNATLYLHTRKKSVHFGPCQRISCALVNLNVKNQERRKNT